MCIAVQHHRFALAALLPALSTQNQSLAKHNRKPTQAIENKHQHPESIASFCRVFCRHQAKRAVPKRDLGDVCNQKLRASNIPWNAYHICS